MIIIFCCFICTVLHDPTQRRVREHCVFCTVTAFVHPPGPCPAQPLCSMSTAHSSHSNGLSGPHTHTHTYTHTHAHTHMHAQPAASMETVCHRTKDTLLLREQHPSSRDLFMCQVDGSDTFSLSLFFFCCGFSLRSNIKKAQIERGIYPPRSAFRLTFLTEYCACTVAHRSPPKKHEPTRIYNSHSIRNALNILNQTWFFWSVKDSARHIVSLIAGRLGLTCWN